MLTNLLILIAILLGWLLLSIICAIPAVWLLVKALERHIIRWG